MEEEFISSSKFSDEHDVFEIRDYTTASEWERFISSFEEILIEWKLVGDDANIVKLHLTAKDLPGVEWHEQTTTIQFADYCFNATHHYISLEGGKESVEIPEIDIEEKDEMPQYLLQTINKEADFASKSHCIARWYGLHQFIILSAVPTVEPLTSHTRTKLVLSALAIAASNTNCQIPLFVQTRKPDNKVFSGLAISNGLRTDFDMSLIKQLSSRHTNLDGFLNILKEKVGLGNYPGADVAAKFTYKLDLWPNTQWRQEMPDYDPLKIDFDFTPFIKLPLGMLADPVSELFLSTFNPTFYGDFDVPAEKYVRSSLDPSFLKKWCARLVPPNYLTRSLLADIMRAFLCTSQNRLSISQILGAEFDPLLAEELNIGSALNKLTSDPVPFLTTIISNTPFRRKREPVEGPLSERVLTQLLTFLFPDSCEDQTHCYPTDFNKIPNWNREYEHMPEEPPLKTVFSNMKSCPVDSFVWRLTIVSCYCVMSIGNNAVAQLIYELYLELRFRWDNSLLIPGVEDGFPNLATCLFNQKLQMLNYCIVKRRSKEGKSNESKGDKQECESEEEFFECNENTDEESDAESLPEWDKPAGRFKRLNKLRLLNSRAFLYIPITQDVPPVTEDRLEQQKEDLMRLGSDAMASHHRARMMSISLLSDMESFKAANPGCVIEDFVRWYSPRDWMEDVEGNGHLSERMLAPGNLWQEVWQNAVPVPMHRQKRLFDETRESESVLQWVGILTPGSFCQELLPVLAHACLARITEESILYTIPASISNLPMPLHCRTLFAQLELVAQRVLRLSRHCKPDLAMYEGLLEQLRTIEIDITRAKSLRLKIFGDARVSSASFNCSSSSSSVNDGQDEPSLAKVPIPQCKDLENSSSPSVEDVNPVIEEEILEKLFYRLLSNQEIPIDDSPSGPQSMAIVKLFTAAIKESEKLKDEDEEPLSLDQRHFYDDPKLFFLGRPFAREYLIRVKGKFPSRFSRKLPHRIFAVVLPFEFRLAGAITQDTLFC